MSHKPQVFNDGINEYTLLELHKQTRYSPITVKTLNFADGRSYKTVYLFGVIPIYRNWKHAIPQLTKTSSSSENIAD